MAQNALTKKKSEVPATSELPEDVAVYAPRVDIREDAEKVLVVADMPGVDESSVTVELEGSELAIRGRFLPKTPEGYSPIYREYADGNYERTFTIGETIDSEKINASVRDGVLRLTLPKAKEAKPKRITVKAG
jgi:HSP20 family molecular chaperone IbpA